MRFPRMGSLSLAVAVRLRRGAAFTHPFELVIKIPDP
jgi:hypothetical protein